MWWDPTKNFWELREWQKTIDGKKFKKTILSLPKTEDGKPPVLQYPFIHPGSADILVDSLKDKCIDLILTDPPYGITQNRWDNSYQP